MKRIKKIAIWLLGVFCTLLLLIFIAIFFYENKLKQQIITAVNESIAGEISISTFDYNLFTTYPKAEIIIEGLKLYEKKDTNNFENPVLIFNELALTIDVSELLNKNYVIDNLSITGGKVAIITYKDSTLNVLNATASSSASEEESEPISLHLKNINFQNIAISYNNVISNQQVLSTLISFNSGLKMSDNNLKGNIKLDYLLDSLIIDHKRLLKNHHLILSAKVESNLDSLSFSFSNGSIKLDLLKANINGYYNYVDSGFVDVRISANHKELHELAKMEILKSENLPDIRSGELSIDAHIIGKTLGQVPLIDAYANLRNLQIYNSYGKMIDKAGFNLKLDSDNKDNLLAASVVMDSISVNFASGGFFKGRAEVLNFKKPAFNLSWEAEENLENINKLVNLPGLDKLNGKLISRGNIAGVFDLKNNKLVSHKGAASIELSNVNFVLKELNYPITSLNGTAYLVNGDVGFDKISLAANGNKININGRVNNFVPFVLGKPAKLLASVSVQSDKLLTHSLLAFDTALANSIKYTVNELDISLMANVSSRALTSYEIFPAGTINIQNLTVRVEGAPPIVNFNGKIKVDKELVALKDFNGIIGKSNVDFSVAVSNYADYLQTNTTEQMVLDVSLKSEKVNAKDFFTINHKFVLPKNYEEEVLKNVEINAKIITTNTELQKTDLLPEFELQLTGLQFKTLYSPVVFKDIFVFGLVKDNNVYINSMFGKFGRSDVFMNAQFDNVIATKDTISRPLKSRISFNAGVLDLDELIKLDETDVVSDSTTVVTEPTNPFAEKFPITDFQVNIGELTYFDAVIRNLKGIIKIDANNKIEMQQVSLESGEFGSFELDGTLDASSRTEAILKSTIKISNVDLTNLNVKYVQGDEEVKISDHFEGKINGEIVANVPILPDFSFDLARLTGKIKVKMTDGALLNYKPLEEMGKYFKNKDLNYIKFDELKNTMIFNGGKMLLPFMTINTTLGTINVMGFQTMDYDMSYDIQVPIKLVAGSALNSMFASKKGDDGKTDKVKKSKKDKYVTVHISGSADAYKFKLGKKHVLTAPPGFLVD